MHLLGIHKWAALCVSLLLGVNCVSLAIAAPSLSQFGKHVPPDLFYVIEQGGQKVHSEVRRQFGHSDASQDRIFLPITKASPRQERKLGPVKIQKLFLTISNSSSR